MLNSVPEATKLRAAILFFINKIPNKLNRVRLCKHLFYADGHFFQKYQRQITEFAYLHIEGSPQPIVFNEIICTMVNEKEIEIIPQVVTEMVGDTPTMVLKGFSYKALSSVPEVFTKEEKKVLKSIASLFYGDLSLETRYYPNLFQQYAQTDLYSQIEFLELNDGKRPHLSWKAWANKIFRLMLE